jgi:hypothetical protein
MNCAVPEVWGYENVATAQSNQLLPSLSPRESLSPRSSWSPLDSLRCRDSLRTGDALSAKRYFKFQGIFDARGFFTPWDSLQPRILHAPGFFAAVKSARSGNLQVMGMLESRWSWNPGYIEFWDSGIPVFLGARLTNPGTHKSRDSQIRGLTNPGTHKSGDSQILGLTHPGPAIRVPGFSVPGLYSHDYVGVLHSL